MATRDRRQSDAPNIYPLGHPKNPKSGLAAPAKRVPTPAPARRGPERAAAKAEATATTATTAPEAAKVEKPDAGDSSTADEGTAEGGFGDAKETT
jgi:hypothetical protein